MARILLHVTAQTGCYSFPFWSSRHSSRELLSKYIYLERIQSATLHWLFNARFESWVQKIIKTTTTLCYQTCSVLASKWTFINGCFFFCEWPLDVEVLRKTLSEKLMSAFWWSDTNLFTLQIDVVDISKECNIKNACVSRLLDGICHMSNGRICSFEEVKVSYR